MGRRHAHPNKEWELLLREREALGDSVDGGGHSYFRVRCACGEREHKLWVPLTPSSSQTILNKRKAMERWHREESP